MGDMCIHVLKIKRGIYCIETRVHLVIVPNVLVHISLLGSVPGAYIYISQYRNHLFHLPFGEQMCSLY